MKSDRITVVALWSIFYDISIAIADFLWGWVIIFEWFIFFIFTLNCLYLCFRYISRVLDFFQCENLYLLTGTFIQFIVNVIVDIFKFKSVTI